MLTGERGLPITSALRFLCVYDEPSTDLCLLMTEYLSLLWVTSGMEVSPETAEKVMLRKKYNMNFSVVSVILQPVE